MSRVATRMASIGGQNQNGQHIKSVNDRMLDENKGGQMAGAGQNQNDIALAKKEISQN